MKGKINSIVDSIRGWRYLPRWGVLIIDLFITLFSFFLVYYLCLKPFAMNLTNLFSLQYQSIGLFPVGTDNKFYMFSYLFGYFTLFGLY